MVRQIYKGNITLIKLRKKHFPLFCRWWNDPELRVWTSESKEIMTREKIEKILRRHLENKNGFDFIIFANKKPIGHVLVQKKGKKKNFEIYIAIGEKKYWDKGIGTVVMKRSAGWFFRNFVNEKALYLEVLTKNARAIVCYEKVGFKKVRLIPRSKTLLMKIIRN